MEQLNFPIYSQNSKFSSRLQRQQIRYLPMSEKPSKFQNRHLNKSLGHLNTIYCDPNTFSQSTSSLPTSSSYFDSASKDSVVRHLTNMCQGFIKYDLNLAGLNFIDVSKPLDEEAFDAMSRVLISSGVDMVSNCLVNETVSIMVLNWLPDPGHSVTNLPTEGYSLLLWPAANGFRRDLFNR